MAVSTASKASAAVGDNRRAMDTARAAYEQMTKASTEAFQAFTKMGGKK